MDHVSPLLIHGDLITLCNPFLLCTDLRPEPLASHKMCQFSWFGIVISNNLNIIACG
jgi:hypothetical protein